jgi:HlyD family secretion protein
VPLSALFRRDGDWAVFRVVGGSAILTPVKIGHRNGIAAEITDGVGQGDRVILHPSDAIADDMPVVARGAP